MRDNRHVSVYLFGAICPERATETAIIMPAANSAAMAEHLGEKSRRVTADAHAVVACDGAGWHQPGRRLVVPDNIRLLRLPPYAPELNPVENVWEYLRANKLSMLVCDSYDAILHACRDWLIAGPEARRFHNAWAVGTGGPVRSRRQVPSGPIEQQDSVAAGADHAGDLGQVQAHRHRVAVGQLRAAPGSASAARPRPGTSPTAFGPGQ